MNDALHLSFRGRKMIETFEGCKLRAYKDAKGVLTIGYGHTSMAGEPMVLPAMWISQEKADAIFAADIVKYENDVKRDVKVPLNQNQFDALVSFDYNCGEGNEKRVIVISHLNEGRFDKVGDALRQFTHSGGRVLPGLVRRRQEEARLFDTPVS